MKLVASFQKVNFLRDIKMIFMTFIEVIFLRLKSVPLERKLRMQ